jgi:AraC-like DNA-binding protein
MQGLRIDRFAGVFGESILVSRPPHPSLRPHVHRYVGYQERTAFSRRREPPTGTVTMIVDLGDGLAVLDPVSPARSLTVLDGFVAGPADHAAIVDSGGRQSGVQVDLTMVGARLLLDRPLREITNQAISLEELFGAGGRRLIERLRATPSWDERFALLDRELGVRLDACTDMPADVQRAWRAMVSSKGRQSVTGLAADLGCSRKHLTSRFSIHLGLPPKTLASILRFRQVIEGLQRGSPTSLAELAAQCGYYDQAHLDRDFGRFAGITPTEHRRLYTPEFGLRAE